MKLRILLLSAALAAALILPAGALTLTYDGADCTEETGAVLIDGTTYVSLRRTAALLAPAARISWDGERARLSTAVLSLTARPGEAYLQYNGRCVPVPGLVRLVGGSTLVPVRALAAALGAEVEWDGQSETVRLSRATGIPQAADYNEDDLYWLSRIISAESRGEPLAGKIAVGTVVLNRVKSSEFPDTIYGVIFDDRWGGQFEPVRNGTVYQQPTDESVIAAKLCLEGAREAGESLYFIAPKLTQNHWTMTARTYVTTIGCHLFYA